MSKSARSPVRGAILGAAVLVSAVLLALWAADRHAPPRAASPGVTADMDSAASPAAEASLRVLEAEPARVPTPQTVAGAAGADGDLRARPAEAPEVARVELELRFVGPDGARLRVASAELVLAPDSHPPRREVVRDADEVRIRDVPAVGIDLTVASGGLRHRPQRFELDEAAARGVREVTERVILWPESWVAVRVETLDGRPFEVLAEALELEPRRLFVGAFEARASLEIPPAGAWPPAEEDPPLAVWRKPSPYQSWSLPGACVGSLQILGAPPRPPLWVGLRVLGTPLGWELVDPRADEVVFRLDAEALESRLARLELRAVGARGESLPDARLTLKADTSAHRRADQSDVRASPDGSFTLERIVPGRYELLLVHGEVAHQDRLDLAPGETRDLGEILLGPGRSVLVRPVDAHGEPLTAFVEVAPYVAGASADELYPPNLWRSTRGDYRLPMPTVRSVVRARGVDPRGHHLTGDRSASVIVDPAAPPPGPVLLEVREPRDVRFRDAPEDAVELEVLDALDLLDHEQALRPDRRPRDASLVPGNYRALLRGRDGAVLREIPFVVGEQPVTVGLH